MKLSKELRLDLKFTLNGSEAIMFEKGGLHEMEWEGFSDIPWEEVNCMKVSFQIDKADIDRYRHIKNSFHPNRDANENQQA